MSSSRIPAVIDAFKTAVSAALPTLEVRDGQPTTEVPKAGLYVGATDEINEITFSQSWAGQGSRARNETFEVPNLLFRRTGDNRQTTVASERTAIFADLAAIEQVLRDDPSLGVAGFTVRVQFGTDGAFSQTQSPDGLVSRVRFTITAETRI